MTTVEQSLPDRNLRALRVRDVMTKKVVTVGPDDQLLTADEMQKNFRCRHMPVVDEMGRLIGMVSQRDMYHRGLLRVLGIGDQGRHRLLQAFLVKEVMVTHVITIDPDATIPDAARRMLNAQVGCLPVVKDGELVGTLSESDIVHLLA